MTDRVFTCGLTPTPKGRITPRFRPRDTGSADSDRLGRDKIRPYRLKKIHPAKNRGRLRRGSKRGWDKAHTQTQGLAAPMKREDQGCLVILIDGTSCGEPCVGKGKCARHYQQARRGRLGKSKKISAPGEAAEVKVTTGKDLKAWLTKSAKRSKVSVSEFARLILEQARNSEV